MIQLYLHNLGCSKNQVDGELLAGWAVEQGVRLTDDPGQAEVIVVNTCAFIQAAKEEAIDAILEAARYKEEAVCGSLYVCGCFPELYQGQLASELPEVDGFFGVGQWPDLLDTIAQKRVDIAANPFLKRTLWTPGHYAHLRIADGCNRGCTYCIIPQIRGHYHSRRPEDITAEAETLAAKGVKELLPVAQELNSYGHDLGLGSKNRPLLSLLADLDRVEGIDWIRPLYFHPPACDRELIDFWADQSKLCRYLDWPIEHASDRVLKAMGRAGRKDQIRRLIEYTRTKMPDVVLRTSIIVGFPGERDEDFQELLDFVREVRFERLGSFQYSAEEGTPAFDLADQIPPDLKDERQAALMELQAQISFELGLARVGSTEEVYVDRYEEEADLSIAHSRKEVPEQDGEILLRGRYPVGEKLSVVIESATEYDLFARPLGG